MYVGGSWGCSSVLGGREVGRLVLMRQGSGREDVIRVNVK